MTTLYGIKNCDTVKKARRWLEDQGIDYEFHDFRVDGVDAGQIQQWLDELGWETVVNRRSTTWKELDPALREAMDADSALAAIIDAPTLVKRPVLDTGSERLVGFKSDTYAKIFNRHTL